jgi:hypothetical protein
MPIFLTLAGAAGAVIWVGGLLFTIVGTVGPSGPIDLVIGFMAMGFGALIAVVGLGLAAVVRALESRSAARPDALPPEAKPAADNPWA